MRQITQRQAQILLELYIIFNVEVINSFPAFTDIPLDDEL